MQDLKKYLKSKTRQEVPSPLRLGLTVKITKVTLYEFTFSCRVDGKKTLRFENLDQRQIDMLYGRV